MPPEAAALSADARAEWLRGDVALQRQKRVGQELFDWAEKTLTAEWINASLDAWGIKDDDDVDERVADLFTAWQSWPMAEKTTISTTRTRTTFRSKLRPHHDTSRTRAFLVWPRRAHRSRLYTAQKVDA